MLSPHTPVAELLDGSPLAAILLIDMHVECTGCSMSRFCSLEDVCSQYKLDLEKVISQIQENLGKIMQD